MFQRNSKLRIGSIRDSMKELFSNRQFGFTVPHLLGGTSLWFNLNFLGHDLNLGLAQLKASMLELISCPKAKLRFKWFKI
jgi:hypothetical protein